MFAASGCLGGCCRDKWALYQDCPLVANANLTS